MFVAAQFTIAKIWNQPKCLPINKWIKENVVHIYHEILLSHKKKRNNGICSNLNGIGNHYFKWSNLEMENQTSYVLTHKWELSYEDTKA